MPDPVKNVLPKVTPIPGAYEVWLQMLIESQRTNFLLERIARALNADLSEDPPPAS